MNMYQKRKARQEIKNDEKIQEKTNINWYIPTLINFLRKPYFTRFHI